jgi:GT2 family glycosyltransferase
MVKEVLPNVSIAIIAHKPDENLKLIKEAIAKQDYPKKPEVIIVSRNAGLAENMNWGIKKSRYNIVITLHGDCIPLGKSWLRNLIEPFKYENVVATCSKVRMPEEFWKDMDVFNKSLSVRERGTVTPLLDEKGCAYRKSAIGKIGYFDEKNYRTAGEDMDLYLKLKEIGKIEYPDTVVLHRDKINLKRRLKKTYRNAEGGGVLVRVYGKKLPGFYKWILKGVPVLGLVISLLAYPFTHNLRYLAPYMLISPLEHVLYSAGFLRGLIKGKQTAYILKK